MSVTSSFRNLVLLTPGFSLNCMADDLLRQFEIPDEYYQIAFDSNHALNIEQRTNSFQCRVNFSQDWCEEVVMNSLSDLTEAFQPEGNLFTYSLGQHKLRAQFLKLLHPITKSREQYIERLLPPGDSIIWRAQLRRDSHILSVVFLAKADLLLTIGRDLVDQFKQGTTVVLKIPMV